MVRVRLLASALLLLASGCPRDVQTPEPGEAIRCDELADCNGGAVCASFPLEACVDGLCEVTPTLVVPCADAGR